MHAGMLISRYVYVVPAKCMRARRTAVVYASSESERLWCLGSTGRGNQRWRTGSYLSRPPGIASRGHVRGVGVGRMASTGSATSRRRRAHLWERGPGPGARVPPRPAHTWTRGPARFRLPSRARGLSPTPPLPLRCPAPRGWPPTPHESDGSCTATPRPATACEYSGRLAGWSGTNQLTHTNK